MCFHSTDLCIFHPLGRVGRFTNPNSSVLQENRFIESGLQFFNDILILQALNTIIYICKSWCLNNDFIPNNSDTSTTTPTFAFNFFWHFLFIFFTHLKLWIASVGEKVKKMSNVVEMYISKHSALMVN